MYKNGDKFIIELDKEFDIPIMGGKKSFTIKNTGLIIDSYSLECLDRYDEAEKANADFDKGHREGLVDILKAIRETAKMESKEREKYFGVQGGMAALSNIVLKFEAEDIIEAVKAYLEKKKAEGEIKVGDEVKYYKYNGFVHMIGDDGDCHIGGNVDCIVSRENAIKHKTGRHFPQIAEVLEKMREE